MLIASCTPNTKLVPHAVTQENLIAARTADVAHGGFDKWTTFCLSGGEELPLAEASLSDSLIIGRRSVPRDCTIDELQAGKGLLDGICYDLEPRAIPLTEIRSVLIPERYYRAGIVPSTPIGGCNP